MPKAPREMRPTTSAPQVSRRRPRVRAFEHRRDVEPHRRVTPRKRDVAFDGREARALVDDARRAEVHPRKALGVEHDLAPQERIAKVPARADRPRVDLEVDALDAVLRIHDDRSRRPPQPSVLLLDAELQHGEPRSRALGIDAKRPCAPNASARAERAQQEHEALRRRFAPSIGFSFALRRTVKLRRAHGAAHGGAHAIGIIGSPRFHERNTRPDRLFPARHAPSVGPARAPAPATAAGSSAASRRLASLHADEAARDAAARRRSRAAKARGSTISTAAAISTR